MRAEGLNPCCADFFAATQKNACNAALQHVYSFAEDEQEPLKGFNLKEFTHGY
ncbi:hypothetical protein KIN_29790 [Litoreibacter roseus]|uniref:Uncharacterized protein n=1 Tax=Litoreibacter roseus TaxID=2601869 RepID=A0A6N6JIJ9_9RHOB|nr:hypothetical protein KIN_29790 [Litoreibacter roseus]